MIGGKYLLRNLLNTYETITPYYVYFPKQISHSALKIRLNIRVTLVLIGWENAWRIPPQYWINWMGKCMENTTTSVLYELDGEMHGE